MRNKIHGFVLNASARPAHVSVVNSENCAFAIGDIVQYCDSVHRAPARPAQCACVSRESRKLRTRDRRLGVGHRALARPAHASLMRAKSCACAKEDMAKVPRLCVHVHGSRQTCACVSSESRKVSMCESESWQGYLQYHRRQCRLCQSNHISNYVQ